jgi:hypothetical protein
MPRHRACPAKNGRPALESAESDVSLCADWMLLAAPLSLMVNYASGPDPGICVAEVGQDATQHCDWCAITTCMKVLGFFVSLFSSAPRFAQRQTFFYPRDEGETRARGKTNNPTSLHMESPLTTRGQCSRFFGRGRPKV